MAPVPEDQDYSDPGTQTPEIQLKQSKLATMSEVTLSTEEPPAAPAKESGPPPVPFRQLFRYADKKDRWLISAGLLAAVLSSMALPVVVVVFGNVTEALAEFGLNQTADGSAEKLSDAIDVFVFGILGTSALQMATTMSFVFCLYYAAARQSRCLKQKFFRSALRQDISWYDTKQMGNFTTRVTDDLKKIEDGIGEKIGMIMVFFMTFFIGVGLAFVSGWKLTLVIACFIPVMIVTGAFMAKLQASFAQKEAQAYSSAGSVAEEVIGAIKTVMAFGGENKESERYAASLQGARAAMLRRSAVTALGVGMVWLTQYASFSLAFWYGTELVIESRVAGDDLYNAGTLTIIFFGILIGAANVGQATPHVEALSAARGAAAAVYSVIERESEIDANSEEGLKPEKTVGHLELRDVHFTYPSRPETQILKGISFAVRPGQTVALVGSSGCGKSTCVQLIQRFYDPEQGEVLLDGRDVRELNVAWLRRQIGVVSQEPVLFGTTIAENIRYGRPDCSMKDIEEAARQANAYDFIEELPLKFDTMVGQKGAQLSGGQKQRIAIARALVRNPRVFLLDEATSALDLRSEAVVQLALDRARSGRTTIVVAHRLSTVRSADVIIALSDGRVVETGTHEQLMKNEGLYHGLVTSQITGGGEEEEVAEERVEEEAEEEEDVVEDMVEDKDGFHLPALRRPSIPGITRLRTLSSGSHPSDGHHIGSEVNGDSTAVTVVRPASKKKRRKTAKKSGGAGGQTEEEDEGEPVSAWRLLRLNGSEWPYLLLGVVGAAIMGGSIPAYAIVFGGVLGNLAVEDPDEALANAQFYGLLFLGIGVLAFLASFAQVFMFGVAGERLTTRIRKLTFKALLRQEAAYFDDSRHTVGVLCSRLSSDASSVQGATGTRLGNMTQAVFTLFLGLGMAFYLSWQLALAALPFVPLCVLGTYVESRQTSGNMAKEKSDQESGNQIAVEAISNVRTVASLGLENMFADRYEEQLKKTHSKYMKRAFLRGLVYGAAQTAPTVSYAVVFAIGKHLVIDGTVPYSHLFMITESLIYGTMVIGAAVAFSPDMNKAFISARRVFALLDRKPTIDSSTQAGLKLPGLSGSISLDGVQFRYPSRPAVTVLRGLNLKVQPGQTVALVGASGCGKSTCVQLLQRLYDPERGDVSVDGQSVSSLHLGWLRSQIGIVSQEPILFDKTIAENIAYGDNSREVPMTEIIEAARDANIHSFITSLPAGYDTRLGSSSSTQLSGGQKQRVAIARALVRRPAILLLDEATSALDTQSEQVVQQALDRAANGRTCLVIAHRLSTIQGADCIVVVNRGRAVEQGTHQELLAKKGMYYELYKTMG
ncbi:ATP-dependent translocase ABCB1-like isoform X2 [Amphibalanus amphitrite]|uniref:ATP-dependent translocase ABCB1-like isoform X2 n=1 Tax=Amphibalanus amphitrite TaxID=1232801 RepID=UPI001C924BD3|nr:ATP-dependent translocase ABCB1-like isoform X2 [Amphibalanus amphitrite]